MLTTIQEEILIGLMLGDGCLELPKHGKNACLRITRAKYDSDYINYHVNIFNIFGAKRSDGEVKDKRTNKIYPRTMLHTSVHPILTQKHKEWYKQNKKCVPINIVLTPTVLATWFADDGSIIIKKRTYTAKLATHGFKKKEVEFLQKLLKQTFSLEFKMYKDNSGQKPHWFLMLTNKENVRNLIQIIDPVFPIGMERKSIIWKQGAPLLKKQINPQCKFCNSTETFKNGSNATGNQKYKCKKCTRQFIHTSLHYIL